MRELMAQAVDDPGSQIASDLPVPGKNGYTFPTCAYCPQAQYNDIAVRNHRQGTVVRTVVVGADGKAHDIGVIKALPDGLTLTAIEAVETWRFNPARGSDGNPAAVRQKIEVTFHLYR